MSNSLYTATGIPILVDEDNYLKYQHLRWCLKDGYAYNASVRYLHQLVIGEYPTPGLYVDHINRVKTDNRRENLRFVTPTESAWNTKVIERKLRNIHQLPDGKHQVWFMRKGLNYHVGTFSTVEEAIEKRDEALANYQLTL